MKGLVVIGMMLLLASFALAAEGEKECPADHAANKGITAFRAFHEVMAPAWHGFYPEKQLDSLVASGPKFDSLFGGIAAIEANWQNTKRKAAFLTNREEFAHLVKAYSEAAKAGLKDSVYALMPLVHEAFEKTASVVVPYSYPALEGAVVTAGLIIDKHLPADNMEGITGSTETLLTKLANLTAENIPADLADQKEALVKEFDAINKLGAELQASLNKKDMVAYKKVATDLNQKLHEVETAYL